MARLSRGRVLEIVRREGPSRMVRRMARSEESPTVVDPGQVALKMRLDYSRGVKDHSIRNVEALIDLCRLLERPGFDVRVLLRQAAEMISKHFGIGSVAISVKDSDGLFRYKVVVGLDEAATKGFDNVIYTKEQLLDANVYPGYEISAHTKLYLAEDHPYAAGEEFSYQRPGLIGMRRRSLTESLEADYMDFYFNGLDGDLLGYIETSGTRLRKLPDADTIIWLELVASIVGLGIRLGEGIQESAA